MNIVYTDRGGNVQTIDTGWMSSFSATAALVLLGTLVIAIVLWKMTQHAYDPIATARNQIVHHKVQIADLTSMRVAAITAGDEDHVKNISKSVSNHESEIRYLERRIREMQFGIDENTTGRWDF